MPGTIALAADGETISFVPDEALEIDRRYLMYLYPIYDLSGNNKYHSYYVTTGSVEDTTAPVIDLMTVSNSQTDVPTNVRLRVVFNEPLKGNALENVILFNGTSPVAVNRSFSSDRRTITLTPKQLLLPSTSYTLSMSDVEDLSGNVLSTAVNSIFETASGADVSSGNVEQTSPENNGDAQTDTTVQIVFSERVDATSIDSGSVRLVNYNNGQLVEVDYQLSADGRTVTMTPVSPLQSEQRYRVYVTYSTYVYDLSGNRINSHNYYFNVN